MYEDRFGTETEPVVVPSLEPERIIGVTDPDDENLVVWGIVRETDPPRQFIEGGEFYVLKVWICDQAIAHSYFCRSCLACLLLAGHTSQ